MVCSIVASFPSLTAKAPSGTTSNISPCFWPDLIYSTKPKIFHPGMASCFNTSVPFMSAGFGPSSKFPFHNNPALLGPKKIFISIKTNYAQTH
ncbi:hypothetical protein Hanom_Chr13g01236381 [Helianthus anomalus]